MSLNLNPASSLQTQANSNNARLCKDSNFLPNQLGFTGFAQ